ncbi:MAG TPA: glycosyltransferase [Patescibacteria group bacterium]|nr:glycosyltransferase [Patescibacteria group bacterium]
MPAKRVLIVAHDFPPYRTSGVYRMTGLTKYLLPLGWMPTILAAERGEGAQDPSLLSRLPEQVEVVRAAAPRLTLWEGPTARALKSLGALNPAHNGHRHSDGNGGLRKTGDFLRSCLYFPDETVSWVPFAFAKAVRLHRRRPFDVIYSSGPPRSSALLGLLLRAALAIPWTLEFRDPWYLSARPLRRQFETKLQNLLLRRADAVVVVTEGHALDLQNDWQVPREKLHVIRNGFDEDDFRSQPASPAEALPRGYFHLSHLGTIYEGNSGNFFPALRELAAERPDLTARLRVNIIGYPDQEVCGYMNDPQLKHLVHTQGFIPHEKALEIMRASDGLLLFWADPRFSRMAVAGKTYEYLRMGRPILAVAQEGGIRQLIEEAKAGCVVHPHDTQAIKRALESLLAGHSENGHAPQPAEPEYVAQFRYDRLAEKLAGIFGKVTGYAA